MRVLDAETKSVEMASRLEMSLCLPRDMSVAAVHPRATTVSHCPRMDQMSRNRPKHCHSPVQTVSGGILVAAASRCTPDVSSDPTFEAVLLKPHKKRAPQSCFSTARQVS